MDVLIKVLNKEHTTPLKISIRKAFDRISDMNIADYIRERLRNKKAPVRKILRAMKKRSAWTY